MSKVSQATQFTTDDVLALGKLLIEVADLYPLSLRTEQHFYPVVCAYLKTRVPNYRAEAWQPGGGRIESATSSSVGTIPNIENRRMNSVSRPELTLADAAACSPSNNTLVLQTWRPPGLGATAAPHS